MSGRSWSRSTDDDRLAFIASLNARLPKKRVIAQGVLRNDSDEFLLCQLTYKPEWDLPGGVVDPGESPAACVVRECTEELGRSLEIRGLLTTTWLPPYRGWDDAVLFLFDLGVVGREWTESLALEAREIVAVHWCSLDTVADRAAAYTHRLLRSTAAAAPVAYLEDGRPHSLDSIRPSP